MGHFVYIICSRFDASFYKGYSESPLKRLEQHNLGLSGYTSGKVPWELVYVEELPNKRSALIRERALKKYSRQQIEKLVTSSRNIVSKFVG